jgi:hypothetical protein
MRPMPGLLRCMLYSSRSLLYRGWRGATPFLFPIPSKTCSSTDIEQVLREKKSFALRCMLTGIKTLQGRGVTWNRFASSVSIT